MCFELGFMWGADDFFWNSKNETPKSHHENKISPNIKKIIKTLFTLNWVPITNYMKLMSSLVSNVWQLAIFSWEIMSLKLVWDIRTSKIVQSLNRCKQVQTKLIYDYLISHVLYLLIHPLFTIHQKCPLTLPSLCTHCSNMTLNMNFCPLGGGIHDFSPIYRKARWFLVHQ